MKINGNNGITIQFHEKLYHMDITGLEKTGLMYTKYTCSYYGNYSLSCIYYTKSVSFTESLMECCICDEICFNTE